MNDAAVPSTLRRINRRLILRHMMQVPIADRGELASVANTSQVTAGRIVDELLNQGVLEPAEIKRDATRPGRPGQSLRLNSKTPRFLLVQLGIERTRVSFAPLSVSEDADWLVQFHTPPSSKEWEERLVGAIVSIAAKDCWGVLLSVPGMVDEGAGRVLFSPNLHWSEKLDFRAILGKLVSAPVELVQEIRTLALGHQSASPGESDFLLVDFGHGVGGAAVLHGALYQSALPMASELGHAPVPGNTRACGCRATGCMETLLSRGGLYKSMLEAHPTMKPSKDVDTWELARKHIEENGLESWLGQSLSDAAAVIATGLNTLGLARVVITGSMVELPPTIQSFLAEQIKKSALWARFGEVHITFAPRRRMRGLISVGIDRLLVDSNGD